jgi:hypothetical protein
MEPLKKLFQNDFFLKLNQKSHELQSIKKLLQTMLSQDLHDAVKVRDFSDNVITLITSKNTVANKLKLMKSKLIASLKQNKHFHDLQDIKIKCDPSSDQVKKMSAKKASSGHHDHLDRLQKKLAKSPLKNTLAKLARNKHA